MGQKKKSGVLRIGLVALSALCGLMVTSCDSPTVNSATVDINTGGGGTTTSCPSSSTSTLIDAGLKGPINIYRGTYSDIKLLPGASTETPLIAYSDGVTPPGAAGTASQSLKFAYWNGTGFNTEVISGDPFAAYVRLAVLSTGIPIVVWSQYLSTSAAYLKVAMRSAAPPASGTWTVSTLATLTTPTSATENFGPIEVSVSPNNDVLVSYGMFSTVANTSGPEIAYCSGPCSAVSSFSAMTAAMDTTNTLNTALTQIGAAWCNNGSEYVPAIAYSSTKAADIRPVYAVCNNATMTNCLTAGNWSVDTTGFTTVGTAPTAVSLFLDPTVSGDEPRIATGRNAQGVFTYYPTAALTCYGTGTAGAFTASTALGADTTAGGRWIKILKDAQSTPGYHIIADDATAGHTIGYFNQIATGDLFSTEADWNTEGALETLALTTASGGGAAISTSSSSPYIYTSYALSVAPFDLRMGVVDSYTTASSNTNAVFDHYDVDASGPLAMPGFFTTTSGAQRNTAVAFTTTGVPGVAYVDFSYGGTNTSGRLKYAYKGASDDSGAWVPYIVGDNTSPEFPSIAFDSDNHPWISYYDPTLVGYYLATNNYTDGSGQWTTYEFPVIPGTATALPSGNETSLAMYTSGGVRYPVMTVIDSGSAVVKAVKSAMLNPATGTWSGPTTEADPYEVSSTALTAGAAYLSTDFDSSGDIFAAYFDIGAGKIDVAYSPSGSGWFTPVAITPPSASVAGLTIQINPATGIPAIAWNDLANNKLYFLECGASSAIGCAVGGWSSTPTTLDSGTALSVMDVQPTYGWEQLPRAALVYSASGVPSVFYTHGSTDGVYGGNLLELTYNGSSWPAEPTIVGPTYGVSGNANTTTSAGSNAASGYNFGGLGWSTVAAESSSGGTVAVSVGMGNALYATSCGL